MLVFFSFLKRVQLASEAKTENYHDFSEQREQERKVCVSERDKKTNIVHRSAQLEMTFMSSKKPHNSIKTETFSM